MFLTSIHKKENHTNKAPEKSLYMLLYGQTCQHKPWIIINHVNHYVSQVKLLVNTKGKHSSIDQVSYYMLWTKYLMELRNTVNIVHYCTLLKIRSCQTKILDYLSSRSNTFDHGIEPRTLLSSTFAMILDHTIQYIILFAMVLDHAIQYVLLLAILLDHAI